MCHKGGANEENKREKEYDRSAFIDTYVNKKMQITEWLFYWIQYFF